MIHDNIKLDILCKLYEVEPGDQFDLQTAIILNPSLDRILLAMDQTCILYKEQLDLIQEIDDLKKQIINIENDISVLKNQIDLIDKDLIVLYNTP